MEIDPEEFQRRYNELSDEALLSIDRAELTDLAQRFYDEELARRRLLARPSPGVEVPEMDEELVTVAMYLFPDEAKIARTLLESASIRCYLENEHTLSIVWTWTYVCGGLRLKVPISVVDEVREILSQTLSDHDSSILAEAEISPMLEEEVLSVPDRKPGRGSRWLLWSILFFFSAPGDNLRIFLVF